MNKSMTINTLNLLLSIDPTPPFVIPHLPYFIKGTYLTGVVLTEIAFPVDIPITNPLI